MITPSIELVSEVFGYKVDKVSRGQTTLHFHPLDSLMDRISIWEFQHLVKKWTRRVKPWTLQSYENSTGTGICRVQVGDGQELTKMITSTETDAVILAGEWVLQQLDAE